MRPTLYHGPLPRMHPQPIAISGMIRTRMKARTARIEKQSRLLADLELLAEERDFEMGLRQLVGAHFPMFYSNWSDYEQWSEFNSSRSDLINRTMFSHPNQTGIARNG